MSQTYAKPCRRIGTRVPAIPIAALLAAIIAAGAGTPRAEARGIATGIADPVTVYAGEPLFFERVRGAGARFVRLNIDWYVVAPRHIRPNGWNPADPADGNYDWTLLDRQVRNATAAGLTPLLVINGAPLWAQRCSFGRLEAPCNPDPEQFALFATALARRYSGSYEGLPAVRLWQPLNEPNLYYFFNPQFENGRAVSPDLYRALLNRFSAAVKTVDPANLVVTAGLAPLKRPGVVAPLAFARKLLCMRGRRQPKPTRSDCDGGVQFDVFALHPYTTGGPTHQAPHRDDISLGDILKLPPLLRAAKRAGRIKSSLKRTPIWITEFGWDTNPPDPGGLKPKLHARWTAEALYRAWRAGVSTFFWYQLRDGSNHGRPFDQSTQSGLYARGADLAADKPKLALDAFRFPFVALKRRKGFVVWGRTPTSLSGTVRLQVWRGRRWRSAGTVKAGKSGVFRKAIRSRYGRHSRGTVRAVYGPEASLPFSLRYVEDFYQPPFG
jgi:hypothetical protein